MQSVYGNISDDILHRVRMRYASAILLSCQTDDLEIAIQLLDTILDDVPEFLDAHYFREELWHKLLILTQSTHEQNYAYDTYLKSKAWKQKREQVLKRDDDRCALCNGHANNVHHKTYINIGREPLSDLTSLCDECHSKFHKIEEFTKSSPKSIPVMEEPSSYTDPVSAQDIFNTKEEAESKTKDKRYPTEDDEDDLPW